MSIEYRKEHDSEPMHAKILKQTNDPLPELQKIIPEDICENILEDLKKLEKFIDVSKKEDFWKALS